MPSLGWAFQLNSDLRYYHAGAQSPKFVQNLRRQGGVARYRRGFRNRTHLPVLPAAHPHHDFPQTGAREHRSTKTLESIDGNSLVAA